MSKRIIITGATGLIGKKICQILIENGEELIIFSRSPKKAKTIIPGAYRYVKYDYKNPNVWNKILMCADAVIHLAGEGVMNKRWNEKHKKNIYESRILSTQVLVKEISKLEEKPEVFICASAIGFYPFSESEKFDETSAPGNSFLSNVVNDWEIEAKKIEQFGVRRVSIRTGIVLDKNEGALAKMLTPFKLFIGGSLGNGKQYFPWIHVDDVVGIFLHVLYNKNVKGVVNAVAPDYLTMKSFSKILGKVLKRPSFFAVPPFILKLVLGEGAEAVLKGAKIKPQRTLELGYKFKFTNVEEAIIEILQ